MACSGLVASRASDPSEFINIRTSVQLPLDWNWPSKVARCCALCNAIVPMAGSHTEDRDACKGDYLLDLHELYEQQALKQAAKREARQDYISEFLRDLKRRKKEPSPPSPPPESSGEPTTPRDIDDDELCFSQEGLRQDENDYNAFRERMRVNLEHLERPGRMILTDRCVGVYLRLGEDRNLLLRRLRSEFLQAVADSDMFYFGICADPLARWNGSVREDGTVVPGHSLVYDVMILLAFGSSPTMGELEDFLIRYSWLHSPSNCMNEQKGKCGQGTKEQYGYLYKCRRKRTPEDDDEIEHSKVRTTFMANLKKEERALKALAI